MSGVRRVIWVVLLALAALQAWAARFSATPDGVSYVDLSDAIVNGRIGDIVNAYWSPLYPALLGVLRLVLRGGPYWEFPLVHLLNVMLFAASIAGFEYFLGALTTVAAKWGRHELESTTGKVIAYTVFGILSLMMTPLSLPTPDLLVTTATFLAFGALLRIQDEPDRRRPSLILGAALVMGSLAKSFFIPWSAIVLLVAAIAMRRSGRRSVATAAAIWFLFVGPWCAVLSAHERRLTFGDTGRLTYIWNVNRIESPSLKIMPHGAATSVSDSVLKGVAVTPDARGTNPVWFDPARWYTGLIARRDVARQLSLFSETASHFFASMVPVFLVIWFAFAAATRPARRLWSQRMGVVVLPALVAMGAYSMVLVTTRYVAPFIVTLTLAVCFVLPWPSRMTPGRVLLGLGVPVLIVLVTPESGPVLSFLNPALAAVLLAWFFRLRGRNTMVAAAVVGGLVVRLLQPAESPAVTMIGGVMMVVVYWLLSRVAIRQHQARRFSWFIQRALPIAGGLMITAVAVPKYKASVAMPQVVAGEPNINWLQAEAARAAGMTAGMPIAIVGSPFEAYWTRTGRHQIVGVVPPLRVEAFRMLPAQQRELLLREFARAGARVVVSLTPQPPVFGDTSWVPREYIGWVKRLPER